MKRKLRAMTRQCCTNRCFSCLYLLSVLLLFVPFVCAQESTPSPVRIPDTLPPSPTPPPPTSEAPVPTEAPPTTAAPVTEPPTAPPPTEAPTRTPTKQPTKEPTKQPTASPTKSPTPPPTASPTESPTPAPVATDPPTERPSVAPSPAPTPSPSAFPSQNPSALLDPTAEPSESPAPSTLFPSDFPSTSPSFPPSREPTVSPSQRPSARPSVSPTLSMQEDLVQVTMTFDDCPVMQGRSIITFESISSIFIKEELLSAAEPPMMDLTVWTNVKSQRAIKSSNRRRNVRVLQQASSLKIIFDTAMEFRSTYTEYDIPQLVGGTWDTPEDQDAFIAALRATRDPTFQDITSMTTEINGWQPGGNGDDDTDTDLFIIIGASVGGAALLFLAGILFVMLRRRRRSNKKTPVQTSNLTYATPQPPTTKSGERISTEIVVEHQDDVSTLGDPMFGAGGMLIPGLEKDETVAASSYVSGDYEYARAYGGVEGTGNSLATGSFSKRTGLLDSDRESSTALDLGQEDQFFSDDSSFEEQYQDGEIQIKVRAPPGKLGMVIDTPSGGIPIVHAIKESSVLASEVKVGDRLLSVDGEDCTGLSAMQVSKLISQRAENPSRVFVFSRSRGRLMSKDNTC